mmetsp:Transcript_28604/g.77177  ORF Transcript_28604/g.77177 Transcript_28604/m.77177 type:complete len:127 (-) Transcript_28604:70-450(-)
MSQLQTWLMRFREEGQLHKDLQGQKKGLNQTGVVDRNTSPRARKGRRGVECGLGFGWALPCHQDAGRSILEKMQPAGECWLAFLCASRTVTVFVPFLFTVFEPVTDASDFRHVLMEPMYFCVHCGS